MSNAASDKILPLTDHVEEMFLAAKLLMANSQPLASEEEENGFNYLKQRQVCVDGYDVVVHYSLHDYTICRMESLEISGVFVPFLPMRLVCKIAATFLGSHYLKYSESFDSGRKIYVWTAAVDERGRPLQLTNPELEHRSYENFNFSYLPQELL